MSPHTADGKRIFDDPAFAKQYAAVNASGQYDPSERVRALARFSDLDDDVAFPMVLLDVGCGNGKNSLILLDELKPDIFVGLDPAATAVELARQHFAAHCPDAFYALGVGDAQELARDLPPMLFPLGKKKIDGAISFEVYHWLDNPVKFLRELTPFLHREGTYTFNLSTTFRDFPDDDAVIPFYKSELYRTLRDRIIEGIREVIPSFSGTRDLRELRGTISDKDLTDTFAAAGYTTENHARRIWDVTAELDARLGNIYGRIACFADPALVNFPAEDKDRIIAQAVQVAQQHPQYAEFKRTGKGMIEKHEYFRIRPNTA